MKKRMRASIHKHKANPIPGSPPTKRLVNPARSNPARLSAWEKALPIQASLKVNTPGDRYEQEADRIANQVMRMPQPQVQRKSCACGKLAGPDGMCEDCKRKRLNIQRMTNGEGGQTAAPAAVHQTLQQPGRPLDAPTRNFMESRFGQDFGKVRVHTNNTAASSAESINALAYTHGANIVFNQGQYQPQSDVVSGKPMPVRRGP